MKGHRFVLLILMVVLLAAAAGCAAPGERMAEPAVMATALPTAATPLSVPLPAPEEISRDFFEWYLRYTETANPLVDGAYRQSPLVSARFVSAVDAALEAMRAAGPGGADPILCAQDIPGEMRYGTAVVDGDSATTVVQQVWNPGTAFEQLRDVTVVLKQIDGAWLIDEIVCPAPEFEPATTPAQVVADFYDWYLNYARTANPLVDKAYHGHPYVAEGFAGRVDEILASFEVGGYDPFLCAQDVPERVGLDGVFMNGPTPNVLVRTTFPGHYFTVDLRASGDGSWQISNVTCNVAPDGLAKAFYTWYLAYVGDTATGELRNPLVDGAYRRSGFLSNAFSARVNEIVAGFERGGYDPFLLAQDVPTAVSVDPGFLSDTVVVGLYFGPDSVKMIQVSCVPELGHWLIDDIGEARPPVGAYPDWPLLADEEHGFSFQYPEGWLAQELDAQAPGTPDDWPTVRIVQLMPPDAAEALAARSGPPDPLAPVIVAPFQVEVIAGDETALERVYYLDAGVEKGVINGYPVWIRREGYGTVEYIFPHPQRADLWLVFSDLVGEFPGREEAARAVADVLPVILMTLTFE
jgi:hypothetical protein